jgi:hypothetical protein
MQSVFSLRATNRRKRATYTLLISQNLVLRYVPLHRLSFLPRGSFTDSSVYTDRNLRESVFRQPFNCSSHFCSILLLSSWDISVDITGQDTWMHGRGAPFRSPAEPDQSSRASTLASVHPVSYKMCIASSEVTRTRQGRIWPLTCIQCRG